MIASEAARVVLLLKGTPPVKAFIHADNDCHLVIVSEGSATDLDYNSCE